MAFNEQWVGTFRGLQGTEFCVNRIYWASDTVTPSAQAWHLATALSAIWTSHMKDLMHPDYTLLEIHSQVGIAGSGVIKSYTLPVGEVGTFTTANGSLPPHDTVLVKKRPDNATIQPSNEQEFTFGKISFSGIPLDASENGLVESTYLADFNTFAEQLETVTLDPGGANYSVDMAMFRLVNTLVGGNPRTDVYVEEVNVHQEIGTQVRRKR